jgi:hypothetical protein
MSNRILTLLITAVLSAGAVIFVYEVLLKKKSSSINEVSIAETGIPKITDARKTSFTATEVIDMIKKDTVYLGDSIVIYDNGDLVSSNLKFQGTINSILSVESNVKWLTGKTEETKIPFQYHLYNFAATVYREQYATEFKK